MGLKHHREAALGIHRLNRSQERLDFRGVMRVVVYKDHAGCSQNVFEAALHAFERLERVAYAIDLHTAHTRRNACVVRFPYIMITMVIKLNYVPCLTTNLI